MPGDLGPTAIRVARANTSTLPMTDASALSVTSVVGECEARGSTRGARCRRRVREDVWPRP